MMTTTDPKKRMKTIIDREKLMTYKSCPACNRPFNLGDPVVAACGDWNGPLRLIHEHEAVFDPERLLYVERNCYEAGRAPRKAAF